jgi:23S rRNA (uracil1939-C5)-methyltransferase
VDATSRVLDLYCGIGNFTLALARRAGSVVGIEGDARLVERARHNAEREGLANVQFHSLDLAASASADAASLRAAYSHVLLDPPRDGARAMLPTVARLQPKRLLYISCHPGSLARDVGALVHDLGFTLQAAGVLDMFPHTMHVESMALLERPA